VSWSDFLLISKDTVTEEERWKYKTANDVNSSPALIGDTAYFGSNHGYLNALNADSGKEKTCY